MSATAADNIKAFPPAETGMVRHVITVPGVPHEADLRVQVVVGKTVQVDGVNRHFFGGALESRTGSGWGFDYLILPKLGPLAGTLMAVPPNTPPMERFVSLGGEPLLLRYNSRLPLVVYVPEGVEVRYRIWKADPECQVVPQG
jgi:ecotin